MLTRQYMLL